MSALSGKRVACLTDDAKRYELQLILWCSFTEKLKLSLHEWTDVTKENSRAKREMIKEVITLYKLIRSR